MKPIQERTDFDDYVTIERCQETGKPVKVYSLDVERALILDSMTEEERRKLRKYDKLVNLGWSEMNPAEKILFNELSDWVQDNDIDLSILPR